jgi:long-chain acyl-CoA synthetase
MKHQINDSGAKFVLVLSLFYNTLVSIQPDSTIEHIIVTNIKEYLPPLAKTLFSIAKEKKEGHAVELRPQDHDFQTLLTKFAGKKPAVEVGKDDLALFQYTGGTTGISKAAMATHSALVANTIMAGIWQFGSEAPTNLMYVGAIPMFHVYGLVIVVCSSVVVGGTIALVPNARDIDDLLDVMHTYRGNIFPGVPALYNAINNHPGAKAGKYDLSSITTCFSGSAPLPPTTKIEFEQLTGAKLIEGFGMSEVRASPGRRAAWCVRRRTRRRSRCRRCLGPTTGTPTRSASGRRAPPGRRRGRVGPH